MNIKVGSYEAKTKLPELLRGVQSGKKYTITLRGEDIAALVPAQKNTSASNVVAVSDMLKFAKSRKDAGALNIKTLIDEGRE